MTPVIVPSLASRLVRVTSAWWIPLGSAATRQQRGHPLDERAQRVVGREAAPRGDRGQGAYVPVELAAAGGRMEEAAQGARGPGRRGTHLLGDGLGDDLALERACPARS